MHLNSSAQLTRMMFNRITWLVVRKRKVILVTLCMLLVVHLMATYWAKVDSPIISEAQRRLDYMATKMQVKLAILGNKRVAVKLNNTGTLPIRHSDWKLYFFSLRRPNEQELEQGFSLRRVTGGLYFITPSQDFKGIYPNESVQLVIRNFESASNSDHSPNWYVTSDNDTVPRVIENTAVYDDSFIEPLKESIQWKSNVNDRFNPYPPEQRYEINNVVKQAAGKGFNVSNYIVPSPYSIRHLSPVSVTVDRSWSVYVHPKLFQVAGNLTTKLHLKRWIQNGQQALPSNNVILINLMKDTYNAEEYDLEVRTNPPYINITCGTERGAYYAIISLLTLMGDTTTTPHIIIHDKPRFPIRSVMLDVSRNFFPKNVIFKVIDLLSMYKMNMLHLHLTDDEGWRIEIPSIPELTQFGSRRCHGYKENKCLPPSLGSGPFSDTFGSGFYSVSDFREILAYASARFVKVVPEIDVPGHSLAAIMAMEIREDVIMKRAQSGGNSDTSYKLTDAVNPHTESVQGWTDNSMNPCLNSTYRFLETVIDDLINIYKGIQPLDILHLGGDEVPNNIWSTSPYCQSLLDGQPYDHQVLRRVFMTAATEVASNRGLDISSWEDGMYYRGQGPYDRGLFKQNNVFVQSWNNVWESGTGGRAIEFANAGYQSILSMATHLYLDHPYEPDPEEKGLTWATRYTDTFKIFSFMPDDIFENADYDQSGNEIDKISVCSRHPCPMLEKPYNIAGMEACLWSETVRNEEHLFYMLNPRLLAVAERAWYKAPFENILSKVIRGNEKLRTFGTFLYALGHRELPNLESHQIPYRIPPPGVHKEDKSDMISVNTMYPNFGVEMSTDDEQTWIRVEIGAPFSPPEASVLKFRSISPSGKRHSKTTSVSHNNKNNLNASHKDHVSNSALNERIFFPMIMLIHIVSALLY